MARGRVWTDFLVIFACILIIGGTIWLYLTVNNAATDQSAVPSAVNAVYEKIPDQTVLPDTVPIDCKVRVQSTLSNTKSYVTVHNKPDDAVCEDVCLSDAAPRTCQDGVCTGTCAGECTKQNEYDPACPALQVTDILVNTFFVHSLYGQYCSDGLCQYYVFLDPAYFTAFNDANEVDYYAHGASLSVNTANLCLDLIADNEASKSCLQPSFMASQSVLYAAPKGWSVCIFRYACGRAALYAGKSTNDANVFSYKRDVSAVRTGDHVAVIRAMLPTINEIIASRATNQSTSSYLRGPSTFEQFRNL